MTNVEQNEDLKETLEALREDAMLLDLALLGADGFVDKLTLDCLLRLSDYLNQHINDICVLLRRPTFCMRRK